MNFNTCKHCRKACLSLSLVETDYSKVSCTCVMKRALCLHPRGTQFLLADFFPHPKLWVSSRLPMAAQGKWEEVFSSTSQGSMVSSEMQAWPQSSLFFFTCICDHSLATGYPGSNHCELQLLLAILLISIFVLSTGDYSLLRSSSLL